MASKSHFYRLRAIVLPTFGIQVELSLSSAGFLKPVLHAGLGCPRTVRQITSEALSSE